MIPRPSGFLCALGFVALAVGLCPARADDADAVKEKLFQAKKAYDGETQKFRTAVAELLDKREEDARKAGDKKLVDQVKAEREKFEKGGELPAAVPPAALAQIRAARTDLDKSYAAAIKDYLRLKEDAAAEAAEKEQQKIAMEGALQYGKRTYLVALKHYDIKVESKWFANNGTQAGTKNKLKLNGELVPHSIFIPPVSKGISQVRYPLAGNWTAFRVIVGVPKIVDNAEAPASPLTFEVLGDGKSLWKSEPVTKLETFQTCEVNVSKVKVLTLVVHCPEANYWAYAVWFEPVLVE